MTFSARIVLQLAFVFAWASSTSTRQALAASSPAPSDVGIDGFIEFEALVGKQAQLPCNASLWNAEEAALILWYKGISGIPFYTLDARKATSLARGLHTPAKEYEKRAFFDVTFNPPVLILENLTKHDEGAFRCRIDFKESRTENFFLNLTITVPPKETTIVDADGRRLKGVIGPYEEGSSVKLTCKSEGGDPTPRLQWYRNKQLIDESFTSDARGLVRNDLLLSDLRRSDLLTVLTCQSSNTDLLVPSKVSVSLDITLKPLELTMPAPRRAISAGIRTELTCKASGSRPPAQISWWLGGSQVKTMSIRETVSHDGNATLSNLSFIGSVEDNGKTLSCRAENVAMKSPALEKKMLLDVHYVPQVRITLGAKIDAEAIREGTDVYFECIVSANPVVHEVGWLFEGKVLFSDQSSGIIISNQSLVLQKVKRQSRGSYRCVALNTVGQGESDEFYLKVLFAPVCRAAQKVVYPVARNELVAVSCDVDADPANVSFRWYLNNSDIATEVRSFTSNATRSVASYIPSSPRTYGSIFCYGENSIGKQREACVYTILPAGPPEALRSCSLRNTSSSFNSLLLACAPGDNGGLRQIFFVEVYEVFNSQAQRLHSNITAIDAPEFQILNLPPGAKFTLNIFAANSKGRGPSVVLSASTLSLPQKQTKVAEELAFSPLLGLLIGVSGALVLIAIIIVVVIRLRSGYCDDQPDNKGFSEFDESGNARTYDARHNQETGSTELLSRRASISGSIRKGGEPGSTASLSPSCPGKSQMQHHEQYQLHQGANCQDRYHATCYLPSAYKCTPAPDVTYAEIQIVKSPGKRMILRSLDQEHHHQHLGRMSSPALPVEYAQLDYHQMVKMPRVCCTDTGIPVHFLHRDSPIADGCSDVETSVEGTVSYKDND